MRGSIVRDTHTKILALYEQISKRIPELRGKDLTPESFDTVRIVQDLFKRSSLSPQHLENDIVNDDTPIRELSPYEKDLKDLYNLLLSYGTLTPTLSVGSHFHVTDKSYSDIVDKSFHNMDKYSIEELKKINLPFRCFYITFEGTEPNQDEMEYIVARVSEDNSVVDIKLFFGEVKTSEGRIYLDRLPRVYIGCGTPSKKCTNYNKTIRDENTYCMKTIRNCHTCLLGTHVPEGENRTVIPKAQKLLHIFLIIYEIMKRLTKYPEVITRIRQDTETKRTYEKTHKDTPIQDTMIEIHKTTYKYIGYRTPTDPNIETQPRTSPCEHYRRGCERTLKSGKVIQVRPSIVNKGKPKKTYKV
jgi:hypothetical protein